MPITSLPQKVIAAAMAIGVGLALAVTPAHAVDIGFGPIDVNVQGFANSDL